MSQRYVNWSTTPVPKRVTKNPKTLHLILLLRYIFFTKHCRRTHNVQREKTILTRDDLRGTSRSNSDKYRNYQQIPSHFVCFWLYNHLKFDFRIIWTIRQKIKLCSKRMREWRELPTTEIDGRSSIWSDLIPLLLHLVSFLVPLLHPFF